MSIVQHSDTPKNPPSTDNGSSVIVSLPSSGTNNPANSGTEKAGNRRKRTQKIPDIFSGALPLPGHPKLYYLLPFDSDNWEDWKDGVVWDAGKGEPVVDFCPKVLSVTVREVDGQDLITYHVTIRGREYDLESDKLGLETGWRHVGEPGIEQPTVRRMLGDILHAQGRDLPKVRILSRSGWYVIDGRRVYVDLDGQVMVFDGQDPPPIQLKIDKNNSRLLEATLPQPPKATDAQVRFYLLTLLELGKSIQAPLIAVALDARGRGHFFHRAECSVYFEAPPGEGKTSCAAFARQMSLDCSYEPVPSVSFRSTATGMELQSLHEADRLILIDNLSVSRSAVATRTTQQADFIDRFVQSVVDGSPIYVRGNRYLRIRQGTIAGGPALFTGEVLPPGISGGTKRRMLRVKWPDGALASRSELTDPNGSWQTAYRRGWGPAREIARRVIRRLGEMEDPAGYLADLDQWGANRMEAALRIPNVPKSASKLFCRAGVILAGARILEIVSGLDPDTLVGPLVEALKRHVIEWAEELDAGEYTPVTQGDEVAALIKAALVSGHLHIRDSNGEIPKEPGLWNGLMPEERGARIPTNGDVDVRGAPAYWIDPPKVAEPVLGIKTADLYHLVRNHPTLGAVPEQILPTRLVELGYALESTNEGRRGVQRVRIGSDPKSSPLRLVLLRRSRVFPDSGSPEDGEKPQPPTTPSSDSQGNFELESDLGRQQTVSRENTPGEVSTKQASQDTDGEATIKQTSKGPHEASLDRVCVLGRGGRLLGPNGSELGRFNLREAIQFADAAHRRGELFGLYMSGEATAELGISTVQVNKQLHPKLQETGLDLQIGEYGRVFLRDGINIHIPSLDSESPWRSVDSAEELLRLLQEFCSRMDGPWMGSSPETARYLALKINPSKINDNSVPPPPALSRATRIGQPGWIRPISGEERSLSYVVPFDMNRAYLSAMGQAILGFGSHRLIEGTETKTLAAESHKKAGLFEVHLLSPCEPWEVPDQRLASGDLVWVTAPTVEYLLKAGIDFKLKQAYEYEHSWRYLRPLADRIEQQLQELPPGPMHDAIKSLYSATVGGFEAYRLSTTPENPAFRPDWTDTIRALAAANLFRHFDHVRAHCGRWPLAVNVDAVAYAAVADTHEAAAAELGLPLTPQLGKFKGEGRIVPMSDFLALPPTAKLNDLFGKGGIFKTTGEH